MRGSALAFLFSGLSSRIDAAGQTSPGFHERRASPNLAKAKTRELAVSTVVLLAQSSAARSSTRRHSWARAEPVNGPRFCADPVGANPQSSNTVGFLDSGLA